MQSNEKIKVKFNELSLEVKKDSLHEWLLESQLVAQGYGTTEENIRYHKSSKKDELIESKHFITVSNPHGGEGKSFWTKRGVIRLGFFIKSERAKQFRDWAEDLILNEISKPLTASEIILMQAQRLVDIERTQAEQSEELRAITEKQAQAESYFEELAKEPISTLQITTRKAFDDLIRSYAVRNGIDVSVIFNKVYKEFSLRYNKDVFHRAKKSKVSIIGWIESNGYMTQVYEVAKTILL